MTAPDSFTQPMDLDASEKIAQDQLFLVTQLAARLEELDEDGSGVDGFIDGVIMATKKSENAIFDSTSQIGHRISELHSRHRSEISPLAMLRIKRLFRGVIHEELGFQVLRETG